MPLDHTGANATILRHARSTAVLWLDKANAIWPRTLREARRINPSVRIVGYSPDDMIQRHCSSRYFIAGLQHYDAFITTKSFGVAELRGLGCRQVVFSQNAYDPATHIPPDNPSSCPKPFAVGFIGHYEPARCQSIKRLCEQGFAVTISGPGWIRHRSSLPPNATCLAPAHGADYTRRIQDTLINLGFLRKLNRDLQTQRSVEIPACGGFMLAERTQEHIALFEEGSEAEFFGSDEELIQKVEWYLRNPEACRAIGLRGLERCRKGRYSYAERLADALLEIGIAPPEPLA